MIRSITVLMAQVASHAHDVDANLSAACHLLDEHPEAELAVFPELFLQAYALKGIEPIDVAAPEGPIAALQRSARRNHTAVVTGLAERRADGMANSALFIDDAGDLVADYAKVHLFGAEPRWFQPGDHYLVTQLCDLRVAPLICYDVEFPEAARAVAEAGAELLVTISANMDPYAEDHALFVRCRALENRVPHVYVNAVGEHGRLRFCGGSAVVDSGGTVVAQLPRYLAEVRTVSVPLVATDDPLVPDYLADRRPGVTVRTARTTSTARPAGNTSPMRPAR